MKIRVKPGENVLIIYNPQALDTPSRNPHSFDYVSAADLKKAAVKTKSKPVGLIPVQGKPLLPGVNWISNEYLEEGIKRSEKGLEWLEIGVLEVIEKRPAKDGKPYQGNLSDFEGPVGPKQYLNIKKIIRDTYDRIYLSEVIREASSMFSGEGVNIVKKACVDQIKKIDHQLTESVDSSQFYKKLDS